MEEKLKQMTFGQALIIGVVIAGVYYVSLYNGGEVQDKRIRQKQSQIKDKQKEIEGIKQAREDAESYQKQIDELGGIVTQIYKAIPEKLDDNEVLKILSDEANDVGMKSISVNSETASSFSGVNEDGDMNFFREVKVKMKMEGTFSQMMLFMSNLTKIDKVIKVDEMILSISDGGSLPDPDSNKSPLITFDASLSAFKYVGDRALENESE